ncbi:MAG: HD domain-containing phosphohydrolase [Longimicrobiales bacterium]
MSGTGFRAGRPDAPLHARIMVVDDDVSNVNVVERLLRRAGYSNISTTSNPLEAEALYATFHPDIVLLDLHMPGLGGFALLANLRAKVIEDLVPVIVLTGDATPETVKEALSSGAKDFIGKPFEAIELVLRVENLLESRFAQLGLRNGNDVLELKVIARTKELANAELATLQLLARAAEFRDDETGRHTQRVGALSAMLADTMGMPRTEVELLRAAAPLHDIGKIGIPDHILLKPGRLTDSEREIMQRHSEIGAEILSATDFPILSAAREIAFAHHERWDGSGYPRGLAGADTPTFARIVAVADVFDALRHDRPYRPGLGMGAVIDHIVADRGVLLDPEIVDAFTTLASAGSLENASDSTT